MVRKASLLGRSSPWRLTHKLGAISVAFVIAVVVPMTLLIGAHRDASAVTRSELRGVAYTGALADVLVGLAHHDRLTRRLVAGETDTRGQRQVVAAQVDASFQRLLAVDAESGTLLHTGTRGLHERGRDDALPTTLFDKWRSVEANEDDGPNEAHGRLIADVRLLLEHVGETSRLFLDPEPRTYHTMEALLVQAPRILKRLHSSASKVSGLLPRKALSLRDRASLAAELADLERQGAMMQANLKKAFLADRASPTAALAERLSRSLDQTYLELTSFSTLVTTELVVAPQPSLQPVRFEAALENAELQLRTLWSDMIREQRLMLEQRLRQAEASFLRSLAVVALAVSTGTALMICLAWAVKRDLRAVATAAGRIAAGGLDVRVRARSSDEVGDVASAFNTMAQDLEALLDERSRLSRERELILEASAEGIYGVDLDGRITFANPAAGHLLGYDRTELTGHIDHDLLHARHADGSDYPGLDCPINRAYRAGEPVRVDSEIFWHRNGSAVEVEYWAQPIVEGGQVIGAVVNFMDVSERKRHEKELTQQALHDSLTNLPNRTLLRDRLELALARSSRLGTTVGVLFLDLDRFKEINDGLGHGAGDEVLVQVAARLQSVVRGEDTVVRFGGDEFVILCDGIASPWEASALAERILECFIAPLAAGDSEFYMTASVGIALACPGQGAEELIRNADSAMYRAKERGRGCVELFDEEFRARTAARLKLQAELRRALDRKEFRLVYQPIVSLDNGAVVGVEALLRWEHPVRGLVSPTEFIALAEETGLIVPIGEWLLGEALERAAVWRTTIEGAENLFMSVNVSARQLTMPNLVDVIATAISETAIDPGAIHLEVTETALMRDVEFSIETLRGLKVLGAHLSVDDFGTGYSSLSYLKRLPLDTMKVDRSFVSGLGSDPHDSSIVSAIVAMGRALGLQTLAEGVETPEQLAELRALGCDLAQGYYFAMPLSAETLEVFLVNTFASNGRELAPGVLTGEVGG